MSYFFNGTLNVTPAVMSYVNDSAMLNQSNDVGNALALIGASASGQPNTALVFGSPDQARKTLYSGELLDAVIRAFNPSSETGGPSSVTAIRVNPASQGALALKDSVAATIINLASADYGLRENQIKVKVEAATGGRGSKLTTQRVADFYTADNIYRNAFQIQYTGAAASAVMTVSSQSVVLQAPSGTTVATIDLNTFTTVQALVDRINAVASFTATVQDGNGTKPALQGLDAVTAQDVKTAAYMARADLQAAVDWFNGSEGFVVATRVADVGTVPAAIPFTYLTGGADGVVTNTQWTNAFAVLQTVDVQWVTPVSGDPAVHAMADAHAAYMSVTARKERRCIVGTPLATTDTAVLALAKAINSDRTGMVHLGGYDYNALGVLTLYPPYIVAAMVAGAFCGVTPGTPMTNKALNLAGLERNLRNPTDTDPLLLGGIIPLENSPTGYRVVQSISTWLTDSKFNRRELSVGVAVDFTARSVRDRLASVKGGKGSPQALGLARSATESALMELAKPEPNGLGVLVGDANNPAFKNIVATLNGDVMTVTFECSPVIPTNYVAVTIFAVPYSGSASV